MSRKAAIIAYPNQCLREDRGSSGCNFASQWKRHAAFVITMRGQYIANNTRLHWNIYRFSIDLYDLHSQRVCAVRSVDPLLRFWGPGASPAKPQSTNWGRAGVTVWNALNLSIENYVFSPRVHDFYLRYSLQTWHIGCRNKSNDCYFSPIHTP
jgi:hypothetical protein